MEPKIKRSFAITHRLHPTDMFRIIHLGLIRRTIFVLVMSLKSPEHWKIVDIRPKVSGGSVSPALGMRPGC